MGPGGRSPFLSGGPFMFTLFTTKLPPKRLSNSIIAPLSSTTSRTALGQARGRCRSASPRSVLQAIDMRDGRQSVATTVRPRYRCGHRAAWLSSRACRPRAPSSSPPRATPAARLARARVVSTAGWWPLRGLRGRGAGGRRWRDRPPEEWGSDNDRRPSSKPAYENRLRSKRTVAVMPP